MNTNENMIKQLQGYVTENDIQYLKNYAIRFPDDMEHAVTRVISRILEKMQRDKCDKGILAFLKKILTIVTDGITSLIAWIVNSIVNIYK